MGSSGQTSPSPRKRATPFYQRCERLSTPQARNLAANPNIRGALADAPAAVHEEMVAVDGAGLAAR